MAACGDSVAVARASCPWTGGEARGWGGSVTESRGGENGGRHPQAPEPVAVWAGTGFSDAGSADFELAEPDSDVPQAVADGIAPGDPRFGVGDPFEIGVQLEDEPDAAAHSGAAESPDGEPGPVLAGVPGGPWSVRPGGAPANRAVEVDPRERPALYAYRC
jgi:hypothetical protein